MKKSSEESRGDWGNILGPLNPKVRTAKYLVLKKWRMTNRLGREIARYYPGQIISLPYEIARPAYYAGLITDDPPIVIGNKVYHPEDRRIR